MIISKMHKLVIPILLLVSMYVNSQIRYGAKGNLQFTNVTEVHEESDTRAFGIGIGLFAQMPLNDRNNRFFFRPEIIYSQQGEDNGDPYNVKYYQSYINVPFMFKYYFPDFLFFPRSRCNCPGKLSHEFFVEAGPQVGFLIQEKNKEFDDKYYGGATKVDFSVGVGVGYSIRRRIELSVRYNYGVTDTYSNYPRLNSTSNLAFTFSYFFARDPDFD